MTKYIEVSDDDYNILMELSKELQIQDNDGQAFPYYWSPSSLEYITDYYNGDITMILIDDEPCPITEFKEQYPEEYDIFLKEFIDDYNRAFDIDIDIVDLIEFIEKTFSGVHIYYQKEERIINNNISIFKSDVINFCKNNHYRLGTDPKPYANSIFRMNKMKLLIECLCRLNNSIPSTDINNELLSRNIITI